MKKRYVALAFLAFVLALSAGSTLLLRTRWAGDRICAIAAKKLRGASGHEVAFAACRIDPLLLEVRAEGVRLGPLDAPLFAADVVSARLSPLQALGGRVHLRHVEALRPRVSLRVAGGGGGATCPPAFLDAFEIQRIDVSEGALDLSLPGGVRVVAPRVDVRSDPGDLRAGLRALAGAQRASRLVLDAGPLRVEGGGRAAVLGSLRAAAEVAHDLSAAELESLEAESEGVRLALRGTVRDLCSPSLDLVATADGPMPSLLALAGAHPTGWSGRVALEVRATGDARTPALAGAARFQGLRYQDFVPGDGRAELALDGDRLLLRRVLFELRGGEVEARGALRLARGLPLELELDLRSVELADVLGRVTVPGAWVTLRIDGRGRVAGTLDPVALSGDLAGDLRDFRVLTHSWETLAAGEQPVAELKRGRLETGVRAARDGLAFEGARVSAGQGVLEADAWVGFASAAGFRARVAGTVDLDVLGHVAGIPWGGLATVDATVGAAPYSALRLAGRLRAERFRFLDVDLGNAAADVACDPAFVLRFAGIEGLKGQTRYRGEATVDLAHTPVHVTASRYQATGRIRDLLDAVRDWLPRTRWLREVVDGDVELSGTASGRAERLDAEFDGRLGPGRIYGRAYDSGRFSGRIREGVESFIDRGEIRRGPGVARARGRWGLLLPFPWDIELEWAGLPLADLEPPGGDWTGSVSGTATLAGSSEQPIVKGAANADGVSWRGVALGTVQAGGTLEAGRAVVTGTAEGLRFSAEASTAGRMPYRARAELALEDVGKLLPAGAAAALRARVEGQAEAEGELVDPGASRGTARLSRLTVGYADFRVESEGPVAVALARGRVDVAPFTLRGANTELVLGGSREASGALDLSASGLVDLRLLGGLVPALKRPKGRLELDAHVSGTAADPVLVGSGQLTDGGFRVEGGATAVLDAVRGALAFSQNRILFDELVGALNGGKTTLRGEIELSRFAPSRLRVEAVLAEVPLAVPAWLPATLSGRVLAEGTPAATTVTGLVHVDRARYTKDVELERSLLELRRKPVAPPRAYDPSAEWLHLDVRVAVDGDVRVDNDLVRGGVRGDLTVTGTLASPGLIGTLSMTEGSRALFRGNEFLLSRAVVSFTDRHRIDATLEVNGDAEVRDYLVHMHLFGNLADPQLQLTSDPALSQPDIITLLSLGFTGREVAAGTGGVTGAATAAAAQALFAASGLDEQVKRFLPPGGLVRDLNVRITSGWSAATSQVEPRAELESWLLRDRLRLRFQSPLSGARGQRVQAEMRLGGNASLQYQWDNENPAAPGAGDHGLDLKLRWEWND